MTKRKTQASNRKGKLWTNKDLEYLENMYGTIPLKRIASDLGRSSLAIQSKAEKIGLTSAMEAGGWLTQNRLALALGVDGKRLSKLHKEKGLPFKTTPVANPDPSKSIYTMRRISAEDFWKWAKYHQEEFDWTQVDCTELIPVPSWYERALHNSKQENLVSIKKSSWTYKEQELAYDMYINKKISQKEIARQLKRTENSVQKKIAKMRKGVESL